MAELSAQIDKTFIAKHNVQKVVSILADYENLQDEVKELLLRLEEDDTSELAEVYRKLKRYVFLRKKLIEKISRQQILENNAESGGMVEDKLLRIEKKFEGVKELQDKFNERIFSVISRTYSLATERPIDLVRVMRIVKNEEVANRAAENSTKDSE